MSIILRDDHTGREMRVSNINREQAITLAVGIQSVADVSVVLQASAVALVHRGPQA